MRKIDKGSSSGHSAEKGLRARYELRLKARRTAHIEAE
jgi:hypothetical protein